MEKYLSTITKAYNGYWHYLYKEITTWHWDNYFYALLVLSALVFLAEVFFPWRKNQPIIRDGFWQDLFYLFFNFFLLNAIFLIALQGIGNTLFLDLLTLLSLEKKDLIILNLSHLPLWLGLLVFFISTDLVQYFIHRLLHRNDFLWRFHKTHHSVTQMGFAAHLRYHWVEPIVYKSLLYIPLAILGDFNAKELAIVHFISIAIGHINHANLNIDYGIFKYIFNNPKMHIWHHSKKLPTPYGVNFGISLSIWDYIFNTHYIPYNGKDIVLGFKGISNFPKRFIQQQLYPFKKCKK